MGPSRTLLGINELIMYLDQLTFHEGVNLRARHGPTQVRNSQGKCWRRKTYGSLANELVVLQT